MGTAPAPSRVVRPRQAAGRRGRWAWVVARLAQLVVVTFVVTVLTFALAHMIPGDAAQSILGLNATPEALAELRAELHLNDSLGQQFVTFISGALRGDLGTSLVQQGRSVTSIVFDSLPVTAQLVASAVVLSIVIGVPVGLMTVVLGSGALDAAVRSLTIVLLAVPPFLLGIALLLLVSIRWGLAPAGGWAGSWPENLRYLWLPALALTGYLLPIVVRTVRQTAQETWRESFVEASLTRGLSTRAVVLRHLMPNSLLPLITLVGFNVGALIAGAVIVEVVFGLPGLGGELVDATASRDYPVIQGIALITAVIVVVVNATTDILYYVVDPRTRPHSS